MIRSGGKQAEKAREKLVSANLRFVVSFRLSLHIVIWYADLRIRLPSATRSRISADYASDKQVDYESMCSDLMMVLRSVLNERERIIVVQSFGIGCQERGIVPYFTRKKSKSNTNPEFFLKLIIEQKWFMIGVNLISDSI